MTEENALPQPFPPRPEPVRAHGSGPSRELRAVVLERLRAGGWLLDPDLVIRGALARWEAEDQVPAMRTAEALSDCVDRAIQALLSDAPGLEPVPGWGAEAFLGELFALPPARSRPAFQAFHSLPRSCRRVLQAFLLEDDPLAWCARNGLGDAERVGSLLRVAVERIFGDERAVMASDDGFGGGQR